MDSYLDEEKLKACMRDLRKGISYIELNSEYAFESLSVNRKGDIKHTVRLFKASGIADTADIDMLMSLFYAAEEYFDLDFRITFEQKAKNSPEIIVLVRVGNEKSTDQTKLDLNMPVEGEVVEPEPKEISTKEDNLE